MNVLPCGGVQFQDAIRIVTASVSPRLRAALLIYSLPANSTAAQEECRTRMDFCS